MKDTDLQEAVESLLWSLDERTRCPVCYKILSQGHTKNCRIGKLHAILNSRVPRIGSAVETPPELSYEEVRRLSDDDIVRAGLDAPGRLTRELANRYDIAVVKLREADESAEETKPDCNCGLGSALAGHAPFCATQSSGKASGDQS